MDLSCLIQLIYLSLHEDHANFQLLNSGTGFVQKYIAGHAPHILSIFGFGWDREVSHSLCGCYLSAFAGCATCFSWAPHYRSPGIDWRVKGTASAVESCSFSWSNRQEGRALSDLSRGPLDSSNSKLGGALIHEKMMDRSVGSENIVRLRGFSAQIRVCTTHDHIWPWTAAIAIMESKWGPFGSLFFSLLVFSSGEALHQLPSLKCICCYYSYYQFFITMMITKIIVLIVILTTYTYIYIIQL